MTYSPPSTYAEWTALFDALKAGGSDDDVLSAMRSGSIEWQSGVAERFAKRLIETLEHRMNAATDRFQREMGRAAGQERAIVGALMGMRREMRFLFSLASIPSIPEADREKYRELVTKQADRVQSSLEDSAKRDRSGKLSSIVRNNKVNTFGDE